MEKKHTYNPSLCLTHHCNLNCIYCYQKHDKTSKMDYITAKECINDIILNCPENTTQINIGFIGGEPLLEFNLIKQIYEYTETLEIKFPYRFFATTNGTCLTEESKKWFSARKEKFILGLSLDGNRTTHNYNRSNSFDLIDIDFFLNTWPLQGVKMTLSEFSLNSLADDIIFLHNRGFKTIKGVNLFEGTFDWSKKEFIQLLIPQLKKLEEYYIKNPNMPLNQMLDKRLYKCLKGDEKQKKWCGVGETTPFYDIDGKKYPCAFITPMTFSIDDLKTISLIDFTNQENFIDKQCQNCYIHPICPTCSGANFLVNKRFDERIKSKCEIQKLIALFSADLQGKRYIENKSRKLDKEDFMNIEVIKEIKSKINFDF